MKQSLFFVPTLKDAPKDAEVRSHKLMTRAGIVKQVAAGIYSYLPLGYKVIKKIETMAKTAKNNYVKSAAIKVLGRLVYFDYQKFFENSSTKKQHSPCAPNA